MLVPKQDYHKWDNNLKIECSDRSIAPISYAHKIGVTFMCMYRYISQDILNSYKKDY